MLCFYLYLSIVLIIHVKHFGALCRFYASLGLHKRNYDDDYYYIFLHRTLHMR